MSDAAALAEIAQEAGGARAPYSRITRHIRREIEAGHFKPGERLPGIREMAKACRVSPFTIGRALNELARDGLVVARSGAGTYVAESVGTTVEVIISYPAKAWPEAPMDTHFFGQIVRGIRESAEPAPRCFTSFMDEEHARAEEILAVCRARRATRLIVYRPQGRMERELAAVAEAMPTVTLVAPLRGVRSGCVTIDPSGAFRRILKDRIAAGRRVFYFAVVSTDIANEYSPYALMYRTFLQVMAESAIQPVILPLTRFGGEGIQQLAAMAPGIPDGAVFIAAYPTLFDAARMNRSRVERISYTERRDTVEKCQGRATLLYGGMEMCAAAAMELFRTPFGADAAGMPKTVRVEPEVLSVP